jgi:ABC-2 type transport system permease protein
MAVYKRSYRPPTGALTSRPNRLAVLPRYAYQRVFKSRPFLMFFVLSLLYPLFCAVVMYIPHSAKFLQVFNIDPAQFQPWIEEYIYPAMFMRIQGGFIFFFSFFIGPDLILMDIRNSALPLYLSRPITKVQYIFGKMLVPISLMSLVGWIPGLLLYFWETSLNGATWAAQHVQDPIALFIAMWIQMTIFVLAALAVSAYARTKLLARVSLFAVYFVGGMFGGMVDGLFGTTLGSMFNLSLMIVVVWEKMLGNNILGMFPQAVVSLTCFALLFLGMLWRKIRAYEIVR